MFRVMKWFKELLSMVRLKIAWDQLFLFEKEYHAVEVVMV